MESNFIYPIEFEFKVLAFAPQFYVRDGAGRDIAYVKQKLLKLKEDITVYGNESQTTPLYHIKANQWIDWSAFYNITDAAGTVLGKMGRKGALSLWKATYEIYDEHDKREFKIEEASAVVKLLDGLFSQVPLIGMFTGYVFNPKYNVTNSSGEKVAEFSKEASFLGKKFKLFLHGDITAQQEERIILSLMMMVLLERSRG